MVTRPKPVQPIVLVTRQKKVDEDCEHLVRDRDFLSRQGSATTAMPGRIAEER
jgi:hypothetical protein